MSSNQQLAATVPLQNPLEIVKKLSYGDFNSSASSCCSFSSLSPLIEPCWWDGKNGFFTTASLFLSFSCNSVAKGAWPLYSAGDSVSFCRFLCKGARKPPFDVPSNGDVNGRAAIRRNALHSFLVAPTARASLHSPPGDPSRDRLRAAMQKSWPCGRGPPGLPNAGSPGRAGVAAMGGQ